MDDKNITWLCLTLTLTWFFCFNVVLCKEPFSTTKATYIVQMDKSAKPDTFLDHLEWYSSKVKSVISKEDGIQNEDERDDEERIIYSYQNVFHGVAARLSQEEAEKLVEQEGVVSILPETKYELHTTRSPSFLGLDEETSIKMWSQKNIDHDVVVGVLDTGIWPESESFDDFGMTPPPVHWKGKCETGRAFEKHHCNRKIIGARIFCNGYEANNGKMNETTEYKSPRDQDGHGTHTAATIAGSSVRGASLLGYASGTARGMAPGARIAAYKVCWTGGCFSSDILSAIDRAVSDGVNILSISLGGGVSSYNHDSLAIAAFGAMEKGVLVSCSAGNGGPDPISLTNVSPWITTVGASSIDRDFPAEVKLGNHGTVMGTSLYKGKKNLSNEKQYPLVYVVTNGTSLSLSSLCLEGTLDPHLVAGKIVICDRGISPRVQKGQVVKNAGGVGMILSNTDVNGEELVADCHLLPAVAVGASEGKVIKRYAASARNATATLGFLGTKVGVHPSPVVAAFSSRGPNMLSLEILKPDIVAPGVNILAAWSGDVGPSSLPTDHRRVKFNMLSGTSMSCPHVSGIAALIKAKHPDWSPAAIKSAIMTTAYVHDNIHYPIKDASTGAPSTPYDHGAGHVQPLKALHPGLVYDIKPQDYFEFLCTQKLTAAELRVFSKYANRTCHHTLASPTDLNYPAISVVFPEKKSITSVTIHRVVTNVGHHLSKYHVWVSPFKGALIKVKPNVLKFTKKHQKLNYKVTITTVARQSGPEFGGLVWWDGIHRVRSPILISWLAPV